MDKHRKSKLMRMAGNIAAGFKLRPDSLKPKKQFDISMKQMASLSVELAEEILKQLDEKYPDND